MTLQKANEYIENRRKTILDNAATHAEHLKDELSKIDDPIRFYERIEDIYTDYYRHVKKSLDELEVQEKVLIALDEGAGK